MIEQKRSYYRNWYQQWQEEKKQEEKAQAMKYFTQMEEENHHLMNPGPAGQLYVRQGQVFQKGPEMAHGPMDYEARHDDVEPPHHEAPYYEEYQPEMEYGPRMPQGRTQTRNNLSKKQMRKLQDVLRGLMLGLPVVIILLAVLYMADMLPANMLGGIFSHNDPTVVAYIESHDSLMSQHNALNQSIASHITGGTLSPEVIATLQNEYGNLQTATNALLTDPSGISSMNRLWSLKLQSLGQMMAIFETHQQVDDVVIATFNQFVSDQNDIGTELTNGLNGLITEHNIQGISIN